MHDLENRTDIKVRGMANQPAPTKIKSFLILLVVGFGWLQLRGATNGFETPPPEVGSIKWEEIHQRAKEQQELHRKRVPVPGAMAADVPQAEGANFASGPKIIAPPTPPPAAPGMSARILLFTLVFAGAAVLVVRKFAPQVLADLNQRFNPWALEPVVVRGLPAKVRAEEAAFAEFLATFRVGPAASSPSGSPEKNDPVREFYARAEKFLGVQRTLLHDIGREPGDLARQKKLAQLCSEVSSLKGEAGFPEALPAWQMASALEGLLKQLTENLGNVTPSALRAVAGGVDLLDDLCVPGLKPDLLTERPLKFLVVDDDLISRQAVSLALKKAFSQPDLAGDGETALSQALQQAYDVIFLDVQLPGMDGFELCTKIHDSAVNHTTPVVFVTGQSDFDARTKSALSGGYDLMGKPFLTFEITVKALTLALKGRLPQRVQKLLTKPEPGRRAPDLPVTVTGDSPPALGITNATRTLPATSATAEPGDFTGAFLATRVSTHLDPLRNLCQTILQSSNEEARQNMLADARVRLNSLISQNGPGLAQPARQTGAALEGLLKKMLQDPKNTTPSSLATMAAALDLLGDLCVPGMRADLATNPPVHILVVDDDLVARRVIVGALQTFFTRPESAENGEAALALAAEKSFDVIFLDVQMPGMDGFEACSKIRATVPNRATPVVFVTGHAGFQTPALMNRAGGNGLMGKPFFASEITVKALTLALRGRLEQLKMQPVS